MVSRTIRTSRAGSSSPAKARTASKLSRAEKVQQTRDALIRAAAEIIGERGYTGAMISLITARAGVAQGTFYNYFESQQDLLDQLLPSMGETLLDYVKEQSLGARTEAEREEERFRAYFSFLREFPEFYRILYEAEVYSPAAYRQHRSTVSKGLTRVLQRAQNEKELRQDYEPRELEALAYMLMGARHYLSMRYARDGDNPAPFPKWVVRTYMKFLEGGIFPQPDDKASTQKEIDP